MLADQNIVNFFSKFLSKKGQLIFFIIIIIYNLMLIFMRRLCQNAQKVNKIILIRLTFSIQNSQMSHRAFWFLKSDGWNGGHISRGGEDDELMEKKLLIKKALQKINKMKKKYINLFWKSDYH